MSSEDDQILVINFWKNDDSFSVYDVIMTSLWAFLLNVEILNLE